MFSSNQNKAKPRSSLTMSQEGILEDYGITDKRDVITQIQLRETKLAKMHSKGRSDSPVALRRQASLEELNKLKTALKLSSAFEIELIAEKIRNCSIPVSSQRSIFLLIQYCEVLAAGSDTIDINNQSIDLLSSVKNELTTLQQCIINDNDHKPQIHNLLASCQRFIAQQEWKQARDIFKQLKRKLVAFDVIEFAEFCRSREKSVKITQKQDVILLLGLSGCGKSTVTHFLAGSELGQGGVGEPVVVKKVSSIHLNDVKISNEAGFNEHSNLNAVTIDPRVIGCLNREASLVVCDTAGFDGSKSPEEEAANATTFVNTLRQCQRVKPVIIISAKSVGDRLSGLKGLLRLVTQVIPNQHDVSKTFSFLFTKYNKNQAKEIHSELQSIKQHLQIDELSDLSLLDLLNQMLKRTAGGASILNPLSDDPGECLDDLIDSDWIKHPDEVFNFSLSKKTEAAVITQSQKLHQYLSRSIDNNQYEVVWYYLNELDILAREFSTITDVTSMASSSYDYLLDKLNAKYESARKVTLSILEQAPSLSDSDYASLQQVSSTLKCITEHLVPNCAPVKQLAEDWEKFIATIAKEITLVLPKDGSSTNNIECCLVKMKCLSSIHSSYVQHYNQTVALITQWLDQKIAVISDRLSKDTISSLLNQITELENIEEIVSKHADTNHTLLSVNELKFKSIHYLNKYINDLIYDIKQGHYTCADITQANFLSSTLFDMIKNTNNLLTEDHQGIMKELISVVNKRAHHLCNVISSHCKMPTQQALAACANPYVELRALYNIDFLSPEIKIFMDTSNNSLARCITQTTKDCIKIVDSWCYLNTPLHLNVVRETLQTLQTTGWLEDSCKQICIMNNRDLIISIQNAAQALQDRLVNTSYTVNNAGMIIEGYHILERLAELRTLETELPQPIVHYEDIVENFNTNIDTLIKNSESKTMHWRTMDEKEIAIDLASDGHPSEVKNLLHFVSQFEQIPSIKSKLSKLNETILFRIRILDQTLSKNLQQFNQSLTCILEAATPADLSTISITLKFYITVKHHHPELFRHFHESWTKNWENFHEGHSKCIHEVLGMLEHSEQLCAFHQAVENLRDVNKLCLSLTPPDTHFQSLFNQYNEKLRLKISKTITSVRSALDNGAFDNAASQYEELLKLRFIPQTTHINLKNTAHGAFKQKLTTLQQESIILLEHFNIRTFKLISGKLNTDKNQLALLRKLLTEPAINEISQLFASINQNLINSLADELRQIRENITSLNVDIAFARITTLQNEQSPLSYFCSDLSNQLDALLSELDKTLQNKLNEFLSVEFKSFIYLPVKKYFQALDKLAQTNPEYLLTLTNSKEAIVQYFIVNYKPIDAFKREQEQGYHYYLSALSTLPEILSHQIKCKLGLSLSSSGQAIKPSKSGVAESLPKLLSVNRSGQNQPTQEQLFTQSIESLHALSEAMPVLQSAVEEATHILQTAYAKQYSNK